MPIGYIPYPFFWRRQGTTEGILPAFFWRNPLGFLDFSNGTQTFDSTNVTFDQD